MSKISTDYMYMYKTAKTEKEKNKWFKYRRGLEKRIIQKFNINEYAGGLLIGNSEGYSGNIVIDINTLEVEVGIGRTSYLFVTHHSRQHLVKVVLQVVQLSLFQNKVT